MFNIEPSNLADKVTKTFLNIVTIFLAAVVLLVFLIGTYDYFQTFVKSENDCQMTWMYQFPHFVKIPLNNEYDQKYPMYGLHIYAEGGVVQDARKQHFTGIPVLFLPGNAGSYKQVRSLASISLYKAYDNKSPFRFDFFTIDFHEEISGMYGYVLKRQLDYSLAALGRIKSLYEDFHRVVIIGHSMGGMIAKSVNVKEVNVHLILTMATPHLKPVAILDPEFDMFYHAQKNASLHKNEDDDDDDEVKVTTVSISGGHRDLLVADKLTLSQTNDFHTSTSAIPGAWVPADHLCILWCKQVVLTVVRVLFDLVDYVKVSKHKGDDGYFRITADKNKIDSVLSYHLYKRSSGKSFHTAHPKESIMLPPKAMWMELLKHQHCEQGSDHRTYLMFPLITIKEKVRGRPEDYNVVVLSTNTKPKNWIFGCTNQAVYNNVRYCSEFENLSELGEIMPNHKKAVHLKYVDIKKYSHIVIKTLPKDSPYCTNLEVNEHNKETSALQYKFTTNQRIFYNFSLDTLQRRFVAWKVEAIPTDKTCQTDNSSIAIFRHDSFQTHQVLSNGSLIIRFANWSSDHAYLQMYFDSKCNFDVSIRLAAIETAGQIFRTYLPLLPSYLASIILLSMFFQRDHSSWSNFHLLLLRNAFNLTIIPGLLIGLMLTFVPSDYLKLMDKSEVSVFLPIVCYAVAFAMVFLLTAAGWYFMVCSGNVLHSLVVKFITKKLGRVPEKVTDFAIDLTFAKFPVVVAVLLVSLSTATCGGLGICVGLFFYLVKIFKIYEDLLHDLLKGKIATVQEGLNPINFHQTIAALWFLIAFLNLPSLVYWTKNIGYGDSPQWDMSMYISLMLTPAVAILWQDFVPTFNPTLWTVQRYLSYATGLMVVIWSTHRLYIISFFITMHLITLAFSQLFSSLLDMVSKSEERRNALSSQQPDAEPETSSPIPSVSNQEEEELNDESSRQSVSNQEEHDGGSHENVTE